MIAETLRKIIAEAAGVSPDAVFLEHPADLAHGDFSSNIALVQAKEKGTNPRELADGVAEAIRQNQPNEVAAVEVAGPGFINIKLAREFFTGVTKDVLADESAWGTNTHLDGKKVMVEYTSPNLFKPLHIGNLVGNVIGESIARLFECSGADVHRLNYPSDIGLTVAKGVWGLSKNNLNPDDITQLGKAYVAGNEAYESDPDSKAEIDDINTALYEESNEEWNELRARGIETSRKHLMSLCAKLGTEFDAEFFESQSGVIGKKVVEEHVGDVFEESNGAVVYRGEQDGLHTRVFLNSRGLPTYEAKEVGLFNLKASHCPDFDMSFTVTGGEQKDFFAVVFAAIRKVFSKETKGKVLQHVANGFLRLTTGKMSSRKGNVVTGESLLEALEGVVRDRVHERGFEKREALELEQAVAVAAVKYSVLRQSTGRDIVFDQEKALSFEGDSGPYLQYAHTRAVSVLEKANREGVKVNADKREEKITVLEKLLYRFPEVVERAAREYEPHYVTTYLTELAGEFNSWYGAEQILDGTPAQNYKLALTSAFATTMKNGLWLLGIRAPEKM